MKKLKIICLIIALILNFTILSGCSGNNTNQNIYSDFDDFASL